METKLQRTLKAPIEFTGIGLHSGASTQLRLTPAEDGNGITFIRKDIDGGPEVRASSANLWPRERRSCLKNGLAEVYTVEHLLAALYALKIDNVAVEIDGEEVPGMDGSATGVRQPA